MAKSIAKIIIGSSSPFVADLKRLSVTIDRGMSENEITSFLVAD